MAKKLSSFIFQLSNTIKPFWGIILFLAAMFGANIIWKLTIIGEEDADLVLLFNKWDISAPFLAASQHVAKMAFLCASFFQDTLTLIDRTLFYPSRNGIYIIWGCTGIKQSFIFLVIMLVARGDWKKKLWFIPLGIALCYVINIVRITAITLIVREHQDLFHLFHDFIFKYLYYGIIFLMWVFWEEVLRKKNVK